MHAGLSFCPGLPNSRKRIFCQHINIVLESGYAGFWRLSRKRLTISATTHTLPERSRKDLSENVWVVALIVNRFQDKRQKQNRLTNNAATHTFPERSFRDL